MRSGRSAHHARFGARGGNRCSEAPPRTGVAGIQMGVQCGAAMSRSERRSRVPVGPPPSSSGDAICRDVSCKLLATSTADDSVFRWRRYGDEKRRLHLDAVSLARTGCLAPRTSSKNTKTATSQNLGASHRVSTRRCGACERRQCNRRRRRQLHGVLGNG